MTHLSIPVAPAAPARPGRLLTRSRFGGGVVAATRAAQNASAATWLLAALPVIDVALAQLQAQFNPQIGPVSLAQAYHGAVLLVLGLVLAAKAHSLVRHQVTVLAVLLFAASVTLTMVMLAAGRKLAMEDLVAALQLGYWMVLWLTAAAVCRNAAECRRILIGVVVAGAYAAVSVIFCYFFVGQDASPYDDVAASAGGLNTAKGLGGILVAAALVCGWLCRERAKLLGLAVLCLCIAALFLTYQRAGLVAFALAITWLGVWYAFGGRRQQGSAWAASACLLGLIVVAVLLATVGSADLQQRWGDLQDPDKAGSARLAFWQVALEHYGTLGACEKALGIGYSELVDSMESIYGARIHTHCDLLDVLAMFGAIGVVGWLAVHFAIIKSLGRASGPALAAGVAVYLVMLSEGLLTGQIFAPHVMGIYLLSFVGLTQMKFSSVSGSSGGNSTGATPKRCLLGGACSHTPKPQTARLGGANDTAVASRRRRA